MRMDDTDTPLDAVRRYIAAFNDADPAAMTVQCADPMQILDGMAPHVWQGPDACQRWWNDVLAEGEHLGAAGYHVTLGEPRHVDVHGDFGYVVVPASMSFTVNGIPQNQADSTFTVALHRSAAGWRLTAWSWSKGHRSESSPSLRASATASAREDTPNLR